MIQYIKTGKPAQERKEINQQVIETVETILADIETRGWQAIRDYSAKFDKWNPTTFKLTPEEIQACIDSLTAQDITDIQFAQTQNENHLPKAFPAKRARRTKAARPPIRRTSIAKRNREPEQLRGDLKPRLIFPPFQSF